VLRPRMGQPQDVFPPQTGVHSEVRERAEWTPPPGLGHRAVAATRRSTVLF
jgi:hypothetical protein